MKPTNRSKKLGLSLNGNSNSDGPNGHAELKQKKRLVRITPKKGGLEHYANLVLDNIKPILCVENDWYHYERGIWKIKSVSEYWPIAWAIQNKRSNHATKSILDAICQQKQVSKNSFCGAIRSVEDGWLINCANCALRIDEKDGSVTMVGHEPEYMFTLQVASRYDSVSQCANFMRVLREILPAEENQMLNLDFATSALMPDSRFQCMLFCTGSGGNGKSTVWEAIANTLGRDVVSRVSYHDLCANNRKYVWRLEHKLLNLGTETIAKPVEENAVVKAITCGEEFDTDRMYGESFPMKTTCKLAFLTNHQITYEAGSNAEVRRTRISHYGETFEGESINRSLEHTLNQERDGIFTMLITRLKRVLGLGEIGFGDVISRDAYAQFRGRNNLPLEFINQCLIQADGYIIKQRLWLVYKKFASQFESRPWSMEAFFKKLYQLRPDIHRGEARKRLNGQPTRVITGIKFSKVGERIVREMKRRVDRPGAGGSDVSL